MTTWVAHHKEHATRQEEWSAACVSSKSWSTGETTHWISLTSSPLSKVHGAKNTRSRSGMPSNERWRNVSVPYIWQRDSIRHYEVWLGILTWDTLAVMEKFLYNCLASALINYQLIFKILFNSKITRLTYISYIDRLNWSKRVLTMHVFVFCEGITQLQYRHLSCMWSSNKKSGYAVVDGKNFYGYDISTPKKKKEWEDVSEVHFLIKNKTNQKH